MISRVLFRRAHLLSLLFAASVVACSDDDGPSGGGTFTLGAPAGAVTVAGGGLATTSIPITFTGGPAVTLSAEGLPAGMTATFNPGVVQPGISEAMLILRANESVEAGTSEITVRAKAEGMTDQTRTLSVTTTAAPGFMASFSTDTAQVSRGQSVTFTVPVERTEGFTAPVRLVLAAPPAGVTFTSSETDGNTASITVNTTFPAPAGVNMLAARLISPGRPDRTGTLRLRIVAERGVNLTIPAISSPPGNRPTLTTTIVREGGYTGPVTVSVGDLPSGVTLVGPGSVTTEGNTASFQFALPTNQAVRQQDIAVTATAEGVTTRNLFGLFNVTAPEGTLLTAGTPVTATNSAARGALAIYRVAVPEGATNLEVTFLGGTGDGDLYLVYGTPNLDNAVCAEFGNGNVETCTRANPTPGFWYAVIETWNPYAGATLTAKVTMP